MHLDFGPDVSGGALFPFLEAFTDMRTGISIARGGASRLSTRSSRCCARPAASCAPAPRSRASRCAGAAPAGSMLAGGERLGARRAVIADVTPTALYGQAARSARCPLRTVRAGHDDGPPGAVGPIPWRAGEDLASFAYVHVAPYVGRPRAHLRAGLRRRSCRTSRCSSSGRPPRSTRRARRPASTSSGCRSARCPPQIRGDGAGEITERDWAEAAEPYADRVLAKLERYAPGVGALVSARAVLSPAELERRNPNLVGGDSLAGSMHLRQNLRLRPFAGAHDYETGSRGAAAHRRVVLAWRRRQRAVGLPRRAQAHGAPWGRGARGGATPASAPLMAHRVVIVGSGFGGLFAAKTLRREPVEVTLIAATNHHLFQPLLYQVATGILSTGEIAPVTRDVLRRQRNLTVELGRGHRRSTPAARGSRCSAPTARRARSPTTA